MGLGSGRVVGFNDHCYVLPSQICISRASVDFVSSERDQVTLHISKISYVSKASMWAFVNRYARFILQS